MKISITLLLFVLTIALNGQGFLHTDGQKIVEGNGEEIILKGIGLGGWLLQEGYMIHTTGFASSQHQFRQKIEDLVGAQKTEEIYQNYRANNCNRNDIDAFASWGFNSIRLPMHYNLLTPKDQPGVFYEEGFVIIDSLLQWCEDNELYLILDLHAAPGGQSDEAISDYNPFEPSLWESQANQDKTVELWKEIATRYADEEWMGGYDVLNEPKWDLGPTNAPLRELYQRIRDAVREVDQNHMLIFEGNWYANDYTGLTPPWDDNMIYSFHKYWNGNVTASIQWLLDMRNQFDIPLWLGETGENSNVWFAECRELMESQNIGWCWWPHKKITQMNAPLNVRMTQGYEEMLRFWNGQAQDIPSAEFAYTALMEQFDSMAIEHCDFQRGIVDALFGLPGGLETLPFKNRNTTDPIFAIDYDRGRLGKAYWDTEYQNLGDQWNWNQGWNYRNDGVDIFPAIDDVSNEFLVGSIDAGEWLQYTIVVGESGFYNIHSRVASVAGDGIFALETHDVELTPYFEIPQSTAQEPWTTLTSEEIYLAAGAYPIRMKAQEGGFTFNYFQLEGPLNVQNGGAIRVVAGKTDETGSKIFLTFNKPLLNDLPMAPGGFTLYANGNVLPITDYQMSGNLNRVLEFTLSTKVEYGDYVTASYNGTEIIATDDGVLPAFEHHPVQNLLPEPPPRHRIPGKIQAEEFAFNSGFEFEGTQDAGGGLNSNFADAGDYLDFLIDVEAAALYIISFRTAGADEDANVELQLIDENTNVVTELKDFVLPGTGGWQTWLSFSDNVNLPEGNHTLRLIARGGRFNLNWIEFEEVQITVGVKKELVAYPNPSDGNSINLFLTGFHQENLIEMEVWDAAGRFVLKEDISVSLGLNTHLPIDLPRRLEPGLYIVNLTLGEDKFQEKIVVAR